ncbi:MAG TPA: alpha/beta hydrolase [Acidimicrobiales bacterium]|nr:alpha/beta hydrolase [Acidimicrobiales bacterium]
MPSSLACHVYDDDRPEGAARLVLVHGVMDRATSFGRVVGSLHDVIVIAYDRRGYAHSIEIAPTGGLDEQVEDLLEIVGDEPASVVGHSLGGVIALMAAQRRPELVVAVGVYEPPMPWLDWWPNTTAGSQAAAEATDPAAAAERFLRVLVGDAAWETLPMRTQQQRRKEGSALVSDLGAVRVSEPPFDVSSIAVPVSVATGSATREHHIKGAAFLSEALGVPLRTVEGAGHNGHQSHPQEFAAFCRAVLASARDRRD